MKKALSIVIVLALLILTFAGCKIETVKEHQAKISTSESDSEVSTTENQVESGGNEIETTTGTTASNDVVNKDVSSTENAGANQTSNGQRTEKPDKPNVTTEPDKVQTATTEPEKATGKPAAQPQSINVTVTVSCEAALNSNLHKEDIELPKDGFIIKSFNIDVKKGESVFSATKKACERNGKAFLYSGSAFGRYVNKIGPIAEKEYGDGSGWTYTVNGEYPNVTCDSVYLKNGDKIEWIFKVA